MSCNRLSLGALALTLLAFVAGLALAYGGMASAFERATTARQSLSSTISAGLSPQHQPAGADDQSS